MIEHLKIEMRDGVPYLTVPPATKGFGYVLRSAITRSNALDHETVMSILERRKEGVAVEVAMKVNTYIRSVRTFFSEYEHERSFYIKYADSAKMFELTPENMPEVLPITFNGEFITSEEQLPRIPDRLVPLGSFELTQPILRITDPCYDVATWCAHTTEAVPGTYDAHVYQKYDSDWNLMHRPGLLAIFHESYTGPRDVEVFRTANVVCNAGVDSGQCGFFDDALYPRDKEAFEYEDDTYYGKCCAMTLDDDNGGGIIDGFGVVTGTFIGDGGYNCYVLTNIQGKVIAACLDYSWHFSVDEDGYEDDDCCDHDAEEGHMDGMVLGCEREGDDDQEDAINCQNDGGF